MSASDRSSFVEGPELYSSANTRVTCNIVDKDNPLVVVTFSNWDESPSLNARNPGKAYLHGRSINNMHVACAGNDWFQYPELNDLGDVCRDILAAHPIVVTYGISMGGYAALAFSKALNAVRVVAIAPQVSIDRKRCPWEKRWAKEAASISFIRDDMAELVSPTAEIFVLFDPFNVDNRHVAELKRIRPVTEIRLPFASHLVGRFLGEIGLLSSLVAGLLERGELPPNLRAEVRARRTRSASYLATAGEKLRARSPAAARTLALRARDMLKTSFSSPNIVACRRETAWLLWALGEREEAARLLDVGDMSFPTPETRAAAAAAFKRDLENLRSKDSALEAADAHALSISLAERGDFTPAIALARRSRLLAPANLFYRKHLISLLTRDGRVDEARLALMEGLETFPDDLFLLGGIIRIAAQRRNLEEGLGYAERAIAIDAGEKWTVKHVMELFAACGLQPIVERRLSALTQAAAGDVEGACRLLTADDLLPENHRGRKAIGHLFDHLREEIRNNRVEFDAEVHHALSLRHLEANEIALAIDCARRAFARSNSALHARHLGAILMRSGELAEAREVMEAAAKIDRRDVIALTHLVQLCRLMGDFGAGLEFAEQALAADPGNIWVQRHLAELLKHNGFGAIAACLHVAAAKADAPPRLP